MPLAPREAPPPSPLLMCHAVSAWSILVCMVAVPLLVFCPLERRAHLRFLAEHGEAEARKGHAAAVEAAAARAMDLRFPRLPLTGVWAADAYLASAVAWHLASWLAAL